MWAQQYHAEKPLLESNRSWYIESVSFAQALIKGMMGLTPTQNETWLKPRIPETLLDKGPVEFSGAYSQTDLWSLKAQKDVPYTFEINVSYGNDSMDHFRFGWDSDNPGIVKIKNMDPKYRYKVTDNYDQVIYSDIEVINGILEFNLDTKKRIIYITSATTATPLPTSLPKPGDANNDEKVNEEDYGIWLLHYNPASTQSGGSSIGDFNNDSKVDGLDYTIWLNNYGT